MLRLSAGYGGHLTSLITDGLRTGCLSAFFNRKTNYNYENTFTKIAFLVKGKK